MRVGIWGSFLLSFFLGHIALGGDPTSPPAGIADHSAFVAALPLVSQWESVAAEAAPQVLVPLFADVPEEERVRIWMSPEVWVPEQYKVFKLEDPKALRTFAFQWAMATDKIVWDFWGNLVATGGPFPTDSLPRRIQIELQSGGSKEGLIKAPGRQPSAFYELARCEAAIKSVAQASTHEKLRGSFQTEVSTITFFIAPKGRTPAAVAILSK